MGCPGQVQILYMQCNNFCWTGTTITSAKLCAFASSAHSEVNARNTKRLQDNLRKRHENKHEGRHGGRRNTRRTKAIRDNEIFGLPRSLFVPLKNVEPAQFGNPAERRLLEIPDARVCTVHCLCDREKEHFRSSKYELTTLMPFYICACKCALVSV